ncbi:MAG: hypothetical protein ACE5GL_11420, partial [Calditrichia bacterium]
GNFYAEGHITAEGKTLVIKDSFAFWDKSEKKLEIFFFPFKLASEDIAEAIKGWPEFVAFKKPSPDQSKWKWCPFGEVDVEFTGNKKEKENISWSNNSFFGMTKKNNTVNFNYNGQDAIDLFETLKIERNKNFDVVEVLVTGNNVSVSKKVEYTWNMKSRTRIYVTE